MLKKEPWVAVEAHKFTMEAFRLKMELWKIFRPVVADSHHFDKEKDPDPH
jgi:hypothetical protein